MKKILAIMMAGVLFAASSVCAFAIDDTAPINGSPSKTAEDVKKEIEELNKTIDKQAEQIEELTKSIKATMDALKQANANASSAGRGSGTSPATDVRTQMLIRNNAVTYGSNTIAQGGHVEINGGKSNVTFLLSVPDSGTVASAGSLAAGLKGTLLNCVSVSSQVAFKTAKVNFYITGVTAGDNIAVYQNQGGKWVQLQTAEIRQDHVVVNMSTTGTVAFIRVPVLASATH